MHIAINYLLNLCPNPILLLTQNSTSITKHNILALCLPSDDEPIPQWINAHARLFNVQIMLFQAKQELDVPCVSRLPAQLLFLLEPWASKTAESKIAPPTKGRNLLRDRFFLCTFRPIMRWTRFESEAKHFPSITTARMNETRMQLIYRWEWTKDPEQHCDKSARAIFQILYSVFTSVGKITIFSAFFCNLVPSWNTLNAFKFCVIFNGKSGNFA